MQRISSRNLWRIRWDTVLTTKRQHSGQRDRLLDHHLLFVKRRIPRLEKRNDLGVSPVSSFRPCLKRIVYFLKHRATVHYNYSHNFSLTEEIADVRPQLNLEVHVTAQLRLTSSWRYHAKPHKAILRFGWKMNLTNHRISPTRSILEPSLYLPLEPHSRNSKMWKVSIAGSLATAF